MADTSRPPMPTPTEALPTEGAIEVRVRFYECDPQGHAHHGTYPAWLEMARTELMRRGGVRYRDMEAAGLLLVVTRLELRYRVPAQYDDELRVHARVTGGGRARIDHAYELHRAGDGGDLIATAETTLACVDPDGRPTSLPEWLRPSGRTPRR